VARVGEAMWV